MRRKRERISIGAASLIFLAMTMPPVPAGAQTIGMVVDDLNNAVIVFDADTDTVLGTVFLPPPSPSPPPGTLEVTGDCSITADQTLGFVTDFLSRIHVIDLTTLPPRLASGTNPIPISNFGEDTSISPDKQFLVVCDGGATQPISVIDIATQTEVHTLFSGHPCNAVEVCSDGSVLVASDVGSSRGVRRLTIDRAGTLTDTGDVLPLPGAQNVSCAPDANSGVTVTPNGLTSFTIPGLQLVDTRPLSAPNTVSAALNPAGDRVFARVFTPDFVDTFVFNSTTGELGTAPLFRIPVARPSGFFVPFGIDQVVVHPNGTKLYVSEPGESDQPGALNVYDAKTGALLRSITDPHIVQPTGVCLPAATPLQPPVAPCTLNVGATFTDGTLTLTFSIGIQKPATWNVWLTFQNKIVRLVLASLPVIDPPTSVQITIPRFSQLGTVGFLTTLTTPTEGIICSDVTTVNTGPITPPASPTTQQLRELFLPHIKDLYELLKNY